MRRNVARERLALTLREIGADFEDRVPRRQRVARGERGDEIGGEPSAAAAQLDDLAARRRREDGRHLRRQRRREQRRHLGRRDEIAVGAELGRSGRVVAESRRVEREVHVARERKRTLGRRDRGAHVRRDPIAVRAGGGAGFG